MNKLFSLSLIAASMFLSSCGGNNETVYEYNVTYTFTDEGSVQPSVDGPNTIKSNEEAVVTLTYADSCVIGQLSDTVSAHDNVSIKDYQEVVPGKKATFTIYEARGDVTIRIFKYDPQP